ncbi:MAG: MraY family glycosyltransferase [Candidatus Omnitrophica bacterium]|nr:MraY family glycosyltransferase [Candidatus Omnitrophota bacterium]
MNLIIVLLAALLITILLTPLCRGVAISLRIVDYPNERKVHRVPTPLLGGVSIFISFVLILAFTGLLKNKAVLSIIAGATIISVFAVYDDAKRITAASRLLSQIVASFVIIRSGIVFTFMPNTAWGKIIEIILTVIWILGITNGLNYLDGLDCLAGGLVVVSSFGFLGVALLTNQSVLQICAVALAGATIGFLPFNCKKRIFLGDMSSTLGFILAAVAIMGTWAEYSLIDLTIPILILGIPVFDMIFTTISRIYTGKIKSAVQWMEYAGLDHFHHRLLNLGLSPDSVVVFIWATNVVLCASALVLWGTRNYHSVLMPLLLVFQAVIVFILISVLMVFGKHKKIKIK